MEGEGSGFDLMYETLLSSGRPAPGVKEGDDRVVVTVEKRIVKSGIVDFITKVNQTYYLSQKELIALGLITQHEAMTANDLIEALGLSKTDYLKNWIDRLKKWGLVSTRGKTRATEYFVEPRILRTLEFKGKTSLKGIEHHRLRELVQRDLEIYGKASISQIHERIGKEIPRRKLRVVLSELVKSDEIRLEGRGRGAKYYWTKTA